LDNKRKNFFLHKNIDNFEKNNRFVLFSKSIHLSKFKMVNMFQKVFSALLYHICLV
jgi:hypothetical protein